MNELVIDDLLAGRKMVVQSSDSGIEITFSDDKGGRACGGCTLCCKLLPVPDIQKLDGERCKHQRTGRGCAIYKSRPYSCQGFVCRWLADPTTASLPRPDRSHYVIDADEDTVIMTYEDGEKIAVRVLQVWCDPAFPDAWDTPSLRAYMLHLAEAFRMATIVRFNASDSLCIYPPPISHDHEWHVKRDGLTRTKEEMQRQLRDMGLPPARVEAVTVDE